MELLSPAGDIETLKYALYAGCDAVYIGGKNFGARAYAKNFSDEDILYARRLTLIYGVKLYVTVNTLVYDNEIDELIDYVRFLHKVGVDAVIVQDIGVISLLSKKFPNLIVHASTQMNTHNKMQFEILKNLGVERIVLAREVSLDEINKIDTDIEREIFVHGALCVSYSGCCLLSSYIGGRSGNRGLCAGTCRLPFELYEDNKKINTNGEYLLSMKDLYTLDKLDEILSSNVHSLKIEGRMKSKEYVYYVTKIYRKYIDEYNKTGKINVKKEDINLLKTLFNREFTNGYLFNSKSNVNIKSSNNKGLYAGYVISCKNGKCKIKCTNKIEKNDGIRIVCETYEYGTILDRVDTSGDIATIYINKNVDISSKVYITSKNNLVVDERKIPINIDVIVNKDNIEMTIENQRCKVKNINNKIVCMANNRPIDNEILKKQLSKVGDTPFEINKINIKCCDNLFINIKDLNEFRRNTIKMFEEKLCENNTEFIENDIDLDTDINDNNKIEFSAYVSSEEQLKIALNYPLERIYVPQNLYYKYRNEYNNLVLALPRINKIDYNFKNEKLLIRELGSLVYAKDNYIVSDYTLNVVNSYSYDFLKKNNVDVVTSSTEINDNYINLRNKNDLEVLIYGKIELAITKYCVVSETFNKEKSCKLCHNNNYYLVDRKKSKYLLKNDNNCNMVILSDKNNDNLNNIQNYINQGVRKFRFNFYDEDIKTVNNILNITRKEW